MAKTPEALYEEKTKRVLDAVQLKVPDRVPFVSFFNFFHAKYGGITCEEAMYDYDKLAMAAKKTIVDFDLDMYNNPFPLVALGPILEALDCKFLAWPGGTLSPHHSYQFLENEYVTAEEYDDLLFDPTGFMLRQFLPRVYGALEPLQQLPQLPSIYYTRFLSGTAAFASPQVSAALDALVKAGTEAQQMLAKAQARPSMSMRSISLTCPSASIFIDPETEIGIPRDLRKALPLPKGMMPSSTFPFRPESMIPWMTSAMVPSPPAAMMTWFSAQAFFTVRMVNALSS